MIPANPTSRHLACCFIPATIDTCMSRAFDFYINCHTSVVYLQVLTYRDCHGCVLTGNGLLHGGGIFDQWYELFDADKIKPRRPNYLQISDSTNFTLSGSLTLLDAPMFNVALDNVHGAEISGLNITSTWCVVVVVVCLFVSLAHVGCIVFGVGLAPVQSH